MRYWTEAMINECLDGTWTRITNEGKFVTEPVDDGCAPAKRSGKRHKVYKAARPQIAWLPEEDEILCAMRLRNRPFAEIAWMVNRSEENTKKRYRVLRVKGAVMM
ncbi:MAG: hypothetical protein WCN98_14425 [Verrucomicrobiaceae bacterium]